MKRIRVVVTFEELDEALDLVGGGKFGQVVLVGHTTYPTPTAQVAEQLGTNVTLTVAQHLPSFLETGKVQQ